MRAVWSDSGNGNLLIATLLALLSGAAFALAAPDPLLMELKPLLAGAVCMGIGALARRPGRAYFAGLLFALSWGGFGLRVGATDVGSSLGALPIALLCGLLALGPAAAVAAWVCHLGCAAERPYANGNAG